MGRRGRGGRRGRAPRVNYAEDSQPISDSETLEVEIEKDEEFIEVPKEQPRRRGKKRKWVEKKSPSKTIRNAQTEKETNSSEVADEASTQPLELDMATAPLFDEKDLVSFGIDSDKTATLALVSNQEEKLVNIFELANGEMDTIDPDDSELKYDDETLSQIIYGTITIDVESSPSKVDDENCSPSSAVSEDIFINFAKRYEQRPKNVGGDAGADRNLQEILSKLKKAATEQSDLLSLEQCEKELERDGRLLAEFDMYPITKGGLSAIALAFRSSPKTVRWLMSNYETHSNSSLPRSTMYNHYLRHCYENKLNPVNAASFGKLIRSVFLGLRTRRLGTRGNSKYHYDGIRIKPDSILLTSKIWNQEFAIPHPKQGGPHVQMRGRHYMTNMFTTFSTSLPIWGNSFLNGLTFQELDKIKGYLGDVFIDTDLLAYIMDDVLEIPQDISPEEFMKFQLVYRKFYDQLTNLIRKFELHQIENLWRAFWQNQEKETAIEGTATTLRKDRFASFITETRQNLPWEIMRQMVELESVQKYVQKMDVFYYAIFIKILLPNPIKSLPASMLFSVHKFAQAINQWMYETLEEFPLGFIKLKTTIVSILGDSLRDIIGLNHLSQTASLILRNPLATVQAIYDLEHLDMEIIMRIAEKSYGDIMRANLYENLEELMVGLSGELSLEYWVGWVDSVLDKITCHSKDPKVIKEKAYFFIHVASYIATLAIQQLIVSCSPSLGSIQAFWFFLSKYAHYSVDKRIAGVQEISPLELNLNFKFIPRILKSPLTTLLSPGEKLILSPNDNSPVFLGPLTSEAALTPKHSTVYSAKRLNLSPNKIGFTLVEAGEINEVFSQEKDDRDMMALNISPITPVRTPVIDRVNLVKRSAALIADYKQMAKGRAEKKKSALRLNEVNEQRTPKKVTWVDCQQIDSHYDTPDEEDTQPLAMVHTYVPDEDPEEVEPENNINIDEEEDVILLEGTVMKDGDEATDENDNIFEMCLDDIGELVMLNAEDLDEEFNTARMDGNSQGRRTDLSDGLITPPQGSLGNVMDCNSEQELTRRSRFRNPPLFFQPGRKFN